MRGLYRGHSVSCWSRWRRGPIVNANSACAAVAGAAVEIWQCDAAGNDSEYTQPTELATVTGSVAAGFTATLRIVVAA